MFRGPGADPAFSGVKIYGPSPLPHLSYGDGPGQPFAPDRLGDLSPFIDSPNVHDYKGRREPETPSWGGGGAVRTHEAERARLDGPRLVIPANVASRSAAVNWNTSAGQKLTFDLDGGSAGGPRTVQVRYSNTKYDAELDVKLNRAPAGQLAMAKTGDWALWKTEGLAVTLRPGNNALELSNPTQFGPRVDLVNVVGGPASTPPGTAGGTGLTAD